jgi:hypothetical protein
MKIVLILDDGRNAETCGKHTVYGASIQIIAFTGSKKEERITGHNYLSTGM